MLETAHHWPTSRQPIRPQCKGQWHAAAAAVQLHPVTPESGLCCKPVAVVCKNIVWLYFMQAKAMVCLLQTYVLKLAKSGSDGEKVFLLLESGTRFHTVQVCCLMVADCQRP